MLGNPRSFLIASSSSKFSGASICSTRECYKVWCALRTSEQQQEKRLSKRRSRSALPVVAQPEAVEVAQAEDVLRLENAVAALEEAYKKQEVDEVGDLGLAASASHRQLPQKTIVKSSKPKRLSLRKRIALKRIELERIVSSRKKGEGGVLSNPDDIWSDEAEELIRSSYELEAIDWMNLHHAYLSSQEEIRLVKLLKASKSLQMLRAELVKLMGREPSDDEWAKASNMDFKTLRRKLQLAEAARNKLVHCNSRLVLYVATKFRRDAGSFMLEDLCQEGVKGLISAADHFNPDRGTRFSTYALYWIRTSIFRAIIRTGYVVQMPFSIATRRIEMRRARRQLQAELGRQPTDEEIMERVGLEADQYWKVRHSDVKVQSLNERVRGSDEEMMDYLPETGDLSSSSSQIVEELEAVLLELKPKEKLVLENRFLADAHVQSLREVGRRVKLSQEMVRKYESRALNVLKEDPFKLARLRSCLSSI